MYAGSARLDDVEFLVRSTNRLDVLDAIRTAPRSRQELREDTDVSRVTLSRILGDLEDRHWITRRNGHYDATPEGAVVAAEVGRLFDSLDAVDTLGPTLRWLPTGRFDFELGRLADAEVMIPDGHDLTAQIRWVSGRIAAADRVRAVATWVAGEILETLVESTVERGCPFEAVVEGHVIDHVLDVPELRSLVRELLDSDGASLYRYDGDAAAITMSIYPDGVLMCGQQDDRSFPEAVATTDGAVVSWATSLFESLRAGSERLDSDTFTP